MKIKKEKVLSDGKVAVTLCMCKGKSSCEPEERPKKIFKTKESMESWKKAFHIK